MNCTKCGTALEDGLKFCPNCGTPVEAPAAVAAAIPAAAAAAPADAATAPADAAASQQQYQQQQQQYQQPYGQQYQQQQYQQPYQQPVQQVWPPQTPANRALAMSMYWSLLCWIFVLCVRDKNDPFIRHHLNNATVILIGSVIFSFLMILIVGFFGLLFLFVMEIMGTVSAYHGDMNDLPLISKIKIIK